MAITKSPYGTLNGKDVNAFVIENKFGTKVQLIEFGATLDKFLIKDKDGNLKDIIVGNLKNPILNKIVPVVVIGGVVYVTATTVAEVMSWESINFFDDTEFIFKGVGKKIVNFFKKPKKGKEDNSGNEEEENK